MLNGKARFDIVREIGAGASGVVYEAVDRRNGALRALKVLKNPCPDSLLRFKREFRALQGIVHPNLVRLRELDVDDGEWFFTMDLVPGSDFLSYVWNVEASALCGEAPTVELDPRRPRFDLSRIRASIRQIVEGVSALHRAGKIHRDLKPSNVRVRPDGRLVILDFGLIFDQHEPSSSEPMVVGTPAYMAPEQVGNGTVGPASDWYALGMMIYEALTGRLPFSGNLFKVLDDRQHHEPAPPSSCTGAVPGDLDRLCRDLLRIDPDLRPSGREILARLDEPTRLAHPSAPAPLPGREHELSRLTSTMKAARAGRPAAALLIGRAGSGKSALLRHAAANAARDKRAVVLCARCHAGERLPFRGFDAVVDALARQLSKLPLGEQLRVLPPNPALLTKVFPVLGRLPALADITLADEDDPAASRRAVGKTLVEIFAALAGHRDVVICIDDLHLADGDSLRVLDGLLRDPQAPPIAFLLAARDEVSLELPPRVERIRLTAELVSDEDDTLQGPPLVMTG